MINRDTFFDGVRLPVFHHMTAEQVAGCNAILDEAEHRQMSDMRPIAYMLGTTWWETGQAMQPVEEAGKGHGQPYGVPDPHTRQIYFGRGLVQLTWKTNYAKMAGICLADLVNKPDLALDLDIAVKIMFEGMARGLFTGKKLGDYFHGSTADWLNARRIINGVDKASTVASAAKKFYMALTAATVASKIKASA